MAAQVTKVDMIDPLSRVALRYQHGPKRIPKPLASAWPSMVSGARNINPDPGYSRAMDIDLALSSSPGGGGIMAAGGRRAIQNGMALMVI